MIWFSFSDQPALLIERLNQPRSGRSFSPAGPAPILDRKRMIAGADDHSVIPTSPTGAFAAVLIVLHVP
jgi:hypothetical protein